MQGEPHTRLGGWRDSGGGRGGRGRGRWRGRGLDVRLHLRHGHLRLLGQAADKLLVLSLEGLDLLLEGQLYWLHHRGVLIDKRRLQREGSHWYSGRESLGSPPGPTPSRNAWKAPRSQGITRAGRHRGLEQADDCLVKQHGLEEKSTSLAGGR